MRALVCIPGSSGPGTKPDPMNPFYTLQICKKEDREMENPNIQWVLQTSSVSFPRTICDIACKINNNRGRRPCTRDHFPGTDPTPILAKKWLCMGRHFRHNYGENKNPFMVRPNLRPAFFSFKLHWVYMEYNRKKIPCDCTPFLLNQSYFPVTAYFEALLTSLHPEKSPHNSQSQKFCFQHGVGRNRGYESTWSTRYFDARPKSWYCSSEKI